MKISSLPEYERPLEKALSAGVDCLTNMELLSLIIQSGNRRNSVFDISGNLLGLLKNGLWDLSQLTLRDLMQVQGVGPVKAASVAAAVELGKRISMSRIPERVTISSAEDIADIMAERLRYEKKEHFVSVNLDVKGGIISQRDISIGELSSAPVHPREVFSPAVKESAASVIFVHNHPSGDVEPSSEDIAITRRLKECGKLLGIRVLDHIIIGGADYASLRSLGYM